MGEINIIAPKNAAQSISGITKNVLYAGNISMPHPHPKKKTCSKACEKIERATIGKIGKSAQNLINAQKAAALSPNSGRFETNAIAKSWVVQSPDGTIYNINNLSLWASEHADMLPGTPTQFSYGIRSIKRTIQIEAAGFSIYGITHRPRLHRYLHYLMVYSISFLLSETLHQLPVLLQFLTDGPER